jgi:hypothetical protein
MAAARIETMRQGERTDLEPSANLQKVARPEAAKQLKVSEWLVASAKSVQQNGTPALQHAVDQGRRPTHGPTLRFFLKFDKSTPAGNRSNRHGGAVP